MNHLLNKSPKVLVVGDLIVDQYLWGSCDRISPEAPVQVINVDQETEILGGAGNVVNNLKALGAEVGIISVVGNCDISSKLINLLNDIKVSTNNLIRETNRFSSKKTRIIAAHQQVVRYDRETSKDINIDTQKKIIKTFANIINEYDVVLLSDYGKGILTKKLTQSLIDISNKHKKKVLIDPKGKDYQKYQGAFLLTPNKKEASEATQISIIDDSTLKEAIIKLKSICKLKISLITLSEHGIAIYDNQLRTLPTTVKEVFDVTGAGDTVLASLGFAIACGYNIDEAVKFSNLAGGVVVGKIGSATASINEIIEYEKNFQSNSSYKNIKTDVDITNICQELRLKKKKIVFTNGCFDILHAGHINYLEEAKKFGDILIVAINSDRSVTSLKGQGRPINLQLDRAYLIAALEVVDYVVIFDQETPFELIKLIKPNVIVKGGDYKDQHVVGEDIVDEIRILDFIDGKSSTKTINKIQRMK